MPLRELPDWSHATLSLVGEVSTQRTSPSETAFDSFAAVSRAAHNEPHRKHNEPHPKDRAIGEAPRKTGLIVVFYSVCTMDLTHVDKCRPCTENLTNVWVQTHLFGSKTSLSRTYDLTFGTITLTFQHLTY
jgi:hypothetical protein